MVDVPEGGIGGLRRIVVGQGGGEEGEWGRVEGWSGERRTSRLSSLCVCRPLQSYWRCVRVRNRGVWMEVGVCRAESWRDEATKIMRYKKNPE